MVLVIAALALFPALPALAEERPELAVEGGGWGHGIGMSQYGALGQALEGRTAHEILEYYYTGTDVKPMTETVDPQNFLMTDISPLWVGLQQQVTAARFAARGGVVKVCQQTMACKRTAKIGEVWEIRVLANGRCRFYRQRPGETQMSAAGPGGPCKSSIKPLRARSRMELLDLPNYRNQFAHGVIRFLNNSDRTLNVSLEIGMQQYLYGLGEVPSSWPGAALEAQVIAARSYAAYKALIYGPAHRFAQSRIDACRCHVYATTVDQYYAGWFKESGASGDKWMAAVDRTDGEVVTYDGGYTIQGIASTFYSSSTGGATENVEDMWNGAAVPYLRSVPDPWSVAPATGNPYASWTYTYQEWELAGLLGLNQVDGVEIIERFDSGTPSRVDVHGRIGGESVVRSMTASQLYSALGLRGRQIETFDIGPGSLYAGDFAGDGTMRPAVVLDFNNAWWLGDATNGDIAVSSLANFSNMSNETFVVGDFDGDGTDEPARFLFASGDWTVAASGAGSGLSQWGSMGAASWTHPLAADLDRDGDADVAAFDVATGTWHVMISNGSGFDAATPWYSFGGPTTFDFAVVGDFDGDRRQDIAAIDSAGTTIVTLFSNGSELIYRAWSSLPEGTTPSDVTVGDLNGDGRSDWAAFEPSGGRWWVALAPETGRTADPAEGWTAYGGQGGGWLFQEALDIDGDGRDELVGYRETTRKVMVAEPSPSGFSVGLWATIDPAIVVTDIVGGDIDGDGDADLVAYDDAGRSWTVLESNGSGTMVTRSAGRLL